MFKIKKNIFGTVVDGISALFTRAKFKIKLFLFVRIKYLYYIKILLLMNLIHAYSQKLK